MAKYVKEVEAFQYNNDGNYPDWFQKEIDNGNILMTEGGIACINNRKASTVGYYIVGDSIDNVEVWHPHNFEERFTKKQEEPDAIYQKATEMILKRIEEMEILLASQIAAQPKRILPKERVAPEWQYGAFVECKETSLMLQVQKITPTDTGLIYTLQELPNEIPSGMSKEMSKEWCKQWHYPSRKKRTKPPTREITDEEIKNYKILLQPN